MLILKQISKLPAPDNQFPDELLKDSTQVAKALRRELGKGVRLYVMADTAYGSCCVDEVGASHVDAECVVHYGHACMSPTSTLPALFVFGKAFINVNACAESLHPCLSISNKPVLHPSAINVVNVTGLKEDTSISPFQVNEYGYLLVVWQHVLYGLEYAHAVQDLKSTMCKLLFSSESNQKLYYSEVACSSINPSGYNIKDKEQPESHGDAIADGKVLKTLESGVTNKLESVRYDAEDCKLLNDFSHRGKGFLSGGTSLWRKQKDANIIGILAGTLGVAGYLHIIQQMKELIERDGKKSYTIVMGRPNPAKLANFPELSLHSEGNYFRSVLISILYLFRGRQWTGEYIMDFQNLMTSDTGEIVDDNEGARFSFLKGCYVEDLQPHENNGDQLERSLALAEMTEKALNVRNQSTDAVLFKGTARSGAEYLAARSYQGLSMQYENAPLQSYVVGRTGRASGYENEKE
ncbi:hypothetical protein J5N97_012620 [Dioscorea zingiberensis]|uniref:2-(3-amino-3-carboxypropyl)histidine synthase subunit 2 n=1 Tax=Dioscorea zingiberensis TaxID=325984 RepID=A0A9D5HHW4_9LILI|nr:hypothetical protein J5N97_012620 [Dioscorea zingiberensis]